MAHVANRRARSSSILGAALTPLSARIAPLVRAKLVGALVAKLGRGTTIGRTHMPEHDQMSFGSRLDPERPVGWESRKTYAFKIASGFFDK